MALSLRLVRLTMPLVLLSAALSPAIGQTIDWTGGGSNDRYDNTTNWSGLNVPDEGETPRFNVAGPFGVTLDTDGIKVNDLLVLQGAVGFASADVGVSKQYIVTDDLNVVGPASFAVGILGQDRPVTLDVADALRIDGGASVAIQGDTGALSRIRSGVLRLADIGSGSGSLSVVGAGARYEQTSIGITNLGQDGPAQLTVSDGASVDFNSVLQLANFADTGASATVLIEGGSTLDAGTVQLANGGSNAGVSADFTVTGTGSTANLSGSLSIGGSSAPTAEVTAGFGAQLNVTGTTTVNASGELRVFGQATLDSLLTTVGGGQVSLGGAGVLSANGGIDTSAGALSLGAAGELQVRGGVFRPTDPSAAEWVLQGGSSFGGPVIVLGTGAVPDLPTKVAIGRNMPGELRVTEGADPVFDEAVVSGGFSFLRVEGAGSSLTVGELNVGDFFTGSGFFTVADAAAADITNLRVSRGSATVSDTGSTIDAGPTVVGGSTSSTLSAFRGGLVSLASLDIAVERDTSGTVSVGGVGTRLETKADMTGTRGAVIVGGNGEGTLTVADNGVAEVGPMMVGVLTDPLAAGGATSTVRVDSGQLLVRGDLVAGSPDHAAELSVTEGGAFEVDGNVSLFENASLIIDNGGTFRTSGLLLNERAVELRVGALLVENTTQNLLVTSTTLQLGSGEINTFNPVPTSINAGQSLQIGGDVIVASGALLSITPGGFLEAGALIVSTGGEFHMNTDELGLSGKLQTAIGSTVTLQRDATLGDSAAVNGVIIAGEFDISNNVVTLLDANDAVFDSGALVTTAGGTLNAPNGLTLDFGGNIAGTGTIDTPNNPTKPLTNNGHIAGESLAEPITLTGYVKGVGTCDNCLITGTDAPGFSPATVVRGSVAYRGTLEVEIGGMGAGEFDRLEHLLGAGVADLGGELVVKLIDGYTPSPGQSFELLTANGGIVGAFDSESLPAVSGGLAWDVLYGPNSVTLTISGVAGDYNLDGVVDAADYTVWRSGLGTVYNQADYQVWRENYGAQAVSASASNAVPEPSAALLVLIVFGVVAPLRQR